MAGPVVILNHYDPNWEKQFEEEKRRILSVTPNKKIQIEHIGSTSIKGLGAKPIIDMMIGLPKLEDFEELIFPLSTIDFEYVIKP